MSRFPVSALYATAVFFATAFADAPSAGAVGGWGSLETRLQEQDTVWVVTVCGTPYQMGYWYGKLLAPQIAANVASFFEWIDAWGKGGLLGVAADQLLPYTPVRYLDEMRGMAAGCAEAGYPEIDLDVLLKIMAVPDLSELGCSFFAAYDPATNGHTYQLRNLDWAMDTGLQDCPVVAVFLPQDSLGNTAGQPHATVGFAGVLGAIAGMNAAGVSVSEIMGYFYDVEMLRGEPMLLLLEDLLWNAANVSQAESIILGADRTNNYHYAVSDPSSVGSRVRLFFTGHETAYAYPDNAPIERSYLKASEAFYVPMAGAVYWKNHDGSGNELMYSQLAARYGGLDDTGALEIARAAGVDGTLISTVTDGTDLQMYVSFAHGSSVPAHQRQYLRIDLGPYFGSGPSSAPPQESATVPGRLALEPNFPNPFNSSTTVRFAVPADVASELSVISPRGGVISVLYRSLPFHSLREIILRWSPDGLPSGVYLLRLCAGARTVTRKCLLLR